MYNLQEFLNSSCDKMVYLMLEYVPKDTGLIGRLKITVRTNDLSVLTVQQIISRTDHYNNNKWVEQICADGGIVAVVKNRLTKMGYQVSTGELFVGDCQILEGLEIEVPNYPAGEAALNIKDPA